MDANGVAALVRVRSCVLQWLVWIAPLHIVFAGHFIIAKGQYLDRFSLLRPEDFAFTQGAYNVSIYENSIGKTYMTPADKMGIYLKNARLKIKYNIAAGNGARLFRAESYMVGDFSFLRLRTHSVVSSELNRERKSKYKLIVVAEGRYPLTTLKFTANCSVVVNILDRNELSPLFYPTNYRVIVSEDAALHSSVAQVHATDPDTGSNGEVYYSLKQRTNAFSVHPTSGVIYVTCRLNYKIQSEYIFDVLAEDRGQKTRDGGFSQKSMALLQIKIRRVNEYSPKIIVQNLASVFEHGVQGTVYAILHVHDPDEADNGEIVLVAIVTGDSRGVFSVIKGRKENEYLVVLRSSLDRELTPNGYDLIIEARDGGTPQRSVQMTLHVNVLDTNDNAPRFSESVYHVTVEEMVPVNTPLLFVHAGDSDMGKNAEIVYEIVHGNELGYFKVNTHNGLVSTAKELDAEQTTFVQVTISAHDQANFGSRMQSAALLQVTITDFNDNSPVLVGNDTDVFVDENQAVGTEIATITAYDSDSGENGYVSYAIANTDYTPFEINHFTGVLTTSEVFDFETMRRQYSVKVRAADWGAPFHREEEIVVIVKIRDLNDNSPRFEKSHCKGYVSRRAWIGTEILVVSAIDLDMSNIVSYQVISGNDDNCFQLNPSTGSLILDCSLEHSKLQFRTLVIRAMDGFRLSDSLIVNMTLVNNNRNEKLRNNYVNIDCQQTNVSSDLQKVLATSRRNNVADVTSVDLMSEIPDKYVNNYHTPEFPHDMPSSVSISESMPVDATVLLLEATDSDPGYNGMLMYSISSGSEGAFKIDLKTGALLVMSELDRESQADYRLIINVTDLGQPAKWAMKHLLVVLTDANDNKPQFEQAVYHHFVSEDIVINATIVQVIATDKDIGINAEIVYSLVSDTEDFSINSKTGIITVQNTLDRETKESYSLLIEAQDRGLKPLSSTATVIINLTDANDNVPKLDKEIFSVKIREDLPIGTVVMTISAYDPDVGAAGQVRYYFLYGMDDKFVIDEYSGIIRINKKLHFHKKQVFNIMTRVMDSENPPLESTCQVDIDIINVNDNLYPPEFQNFVSQTVVKENEPIGTIVTRVAARDPDLDDYRADDVTYSIRDGSGLGRFTIDLNGTIRTKQVLDRETATHYWLSVYAQDKGVIPLSSRLDVYIEIEDVNDNSPQTRLPIYHASVKESSPKGVRIVKIEAEDLDYNVDQRLSFQITAGNEDEFFKIDPVTGEISTTEKPLDRELKAEHSLEVVINDNGHPDLYSVTHVIVTVIDVNDNTPAFQDRRQRFSILQPENNSADQPLFRVLALDNDVGENSEVSYYIKGTCDWCHIDTDTGMVYSTKALYSNEDGYRVAIRAIDKGTPKLKSAPTRVRVQVLKRPNNSSHVPEFKRSGFEAIVMENSQVGKMVAVIDAVDLGKDRLWYNIEGGDDERTFFITPEKGVILLAQKLDWEQKSLYNLTISATDGVHTAYSWVSVKVMDVNDNAPAFSNTKYFATVSESVPVGTHVLTVSAHDADDQSSRLLYSIYNAVSATTLNKFQIDSHTGLITVRQTLDHEALSRHMLTLMVRDQSTKPKRNFARVVIDIQDENDHAPEFMTSVYSGKVFETTSVGTSVLQVLAVDYDKGSNAEVHYSIISGNVGNAFSVDEKLGLIQVAKELDRTLQQNYILSIKAHDQGLPPLSSTTTVSIEITISNNAAPKFTQEEYVTEIDENAKPGRPLVNVKAESTSSVIYEIIGDMVDYFDVNPNSGLFTAKIALDYEAEILYNVTIKASNIVHASSYTCVLVHVVDLNDNKPIFVSPYYQGFVSEVATKGTLVFDGDQNPLVVKAFDNDSGPNGILTYQIVEELARKYFSIDQSTGAIRVVSPVDHEETNKVDFTVSVFDSGKPQLHADLDAEVVIHISDVNDSPPYFDQSTYNANVLLPTYSDVVVVSVTAYDPDTEVDSKLVYKIKSGNEGRKFQINSNSGSIFVMDEKNMLPEYQLIVSVTDNTFESDAVVNIVVKRTEATGLRFTEDKYSTNVEENSTEIQMITIVQVMGHSLNEHLTFKILNPNEMFTIGNTSGVIRSQRSAFDRESKDQYTIVVEARDNRQEPRIAHTIVEVTVDDKNDNAPVFVNQPYHSVITINARVGTKILQVKALDRDIGDNEAIHYVIVGTDATSAHTRHGEVQYVVVDDDNTMFDIDSDTGQIFLKKPLHSNETQVDYLLTVEAIDRGYPVMRSQSIVTVKVIMVEAPVFDKQYYRVSVPEDIRVNTAVMSLQATSPSGHKLLYSITEGDIYGEFDVDFNTAMDDLGPSVLYVVDSLDYETKQRYRLIIRATDVFTGSYSETTVAVQIQDVNDKSPVFQSHMYTQMLSESVHPGAFILSLSAQDEDSGINQQVLYDIHDFSVDRNDSAYFSIDTETGDLTLQVAVDREQTQELYFLAVATDSGNKPLRSVVPVHIIITDTNDNCPEFSQPSFDCTISDQARRGQFVTAVTAHDPDSSDSGQLAYTIISGNDKETFRISQYSGVVSLAKSLGDDIQAVYFLNVSVTDGVFSSYARVSIAVEMLDSPWPKFTQDVYTVEFPENMGSGLHVAMVMIHENDVRSYESLTYHIMSDRLSSIFRIDRDTGEIFSNTILDREEQSEYDIPVAIADGQGRMAFTRVHVNVRDQNDHVPQFLLEEYKGNIHYNATINTSILRVRAVDFDSGVNQELHYSLYHNDDDNRAGRLFDIHPDTGVISVTGDLTSSVNQVYQFFVCASDQGSPALENNVAVVILVMGTEDIPPLFMRKSYSYFIDENVVMGSVIGAVNAWSLQDDDIKYTIVAGNLETSNYPIKFALNAKQQIVVLGDLDHERVAEYMLTVRVETETSPPLVDHTKVTIHVRDLNDNHPQFAANPYMILVPENAEPGLKVVQVVASDADDGDAGRVGYTFAADIGDLANIFTIDPVTGWIALLTYLDREETSEYNLTVVATDKSRFGERLRNTTQVVIRVIDYNDEAPVFSQSMYKVAVNEDAVPGTVVIDVTTTDKDEGRNQDVSYYITSGDTNNQFGIRVTGDLFVNRALDRETKSSYRLKIKATDGLFVTEALVVVEVLDANDNAPKCNQPLYTEFVGEDAASKEYILRMLATDEDEAGTSNAQIMYTLTGLGAEHFNLDDSTGILTVDQSLDRETQSEYRLTAHATDGGGKFCTSDILLFIQDVNDNAPQFAMATYSFSVSESAEVHTLVTRVTATDADLGINHKVYYHLDNNQLASRFFRLDDISGIMSLRQQLDRESLPFINITVLAYDKGNPQLSNKTILTIIVLDINDNPPEFEKTIYHGSIAENAVIGTSVLAVMATSKDEGVNAEIYYSIITGNDQLQFSIDPKTGVLRVAAVLDYETTKEYFLTVLAEDGGTPSLSNSAVIQLNITDVNDNTPVFAHISYSVLVAEDAKIGREILKVMAHDEDSLVNANITYQIASGDTGQAFVVDSRGFMRVAGRLDRETVSSYALQVEATDNGHPALTGSTLVNVTVTDANDCLPLFSQSNYTTFVQEDRDIGHTLVQFVIMDCDLDPNGPPFSFDIVQGNSGNEFRISSSGVLSTAGIFQKDVTDVYNLTIRVVDNGLPALFSYTHVVVNVIEESSYPPEIKPLIIVINSYLDEFPGGSVGVIEAKDQDIYDTLTYDISSPNKHLFSIDKELGNIAAYPGLDSGYYAINVSVSDGKYESFSDVRVNVNVISQDMIDNAVTLQLASLADDDFLKNHLKSFKKAIKRELSVKTKNIHVINVQPSSLTTPSTKYTEYTVVNDKPARTRRNVDTVSMDTDQDNLDVLFAVKNSHNVYIRSNQLRRSIKDSMGDIQDFMNVRIIKVFNDICKKNFCQNGNCKSFIEFETDRVIAHKTNRESFVTARHTYAHTCQCWEGFTGDECDQELITCVNDPCPRHMVCKHHDVDGYRCMCPEGRRGMNCDQIVVTTVHCEDTNCQRGDEPLMFSGRSYARWTLIDAMEHQLTISFKIKTRKPTATLMFTPGNADYCVLELVQGMLRFRFNLGSGEGMAVIPLVINDGEWHEILLEREKNVADLLLDRKYSAQAHAAGNNDVLNLAGYHVYFGAAVTTLTNGYKDIQNGFEGCIDDVRFSGIRLPASGGNSVATSQEFEDVEFHCRDMTWQIGSSGGACGDIPCQNGGTCVSIARDSFVCHCKHSHSGATCEVNLNPCSSNPCMHGGTCHNVKDLPNGFRCACKRDLSGRRCSYGYYCKPSTCKNSGLCSEGPTTPICHCVDPAFEGPFCEFEVDPCSSLPCQNRGTCIRSGHNYSCICADGTGGVNCGEMLLPAVTSNKSGIGQDEIYGIAGCVAGILFIVILVVIILLWRRRRRHNCGNVTAGIAGDNTHDVLLNSITDDIKRGTKISNLDVEFQNIPPSPRPPPIPNRPHSYAPSCNASVNTLNNFDMVRNYGSNGDELENGQNGALLAMHEYSTFRAPMPLRHNSNSGAASIAPSLPAVPSSNPASDTESIHKASWEFDYPNILENYKQADKSEQIKMIPLMDDIPHTHAQLMRGNNSFSSLAISESEEDLPSYHWDMSDLASSNQVFLSNISEVPGKEVPDSPSSSRDSNQHEMQLLPNVSGVDDDDDEEHVICPYDDSECVENDSEYVGDSEYAENEFEDDDNYNVDDFPAPPNFQEILALQGVDGDSYVLPEQNFNVHLNAYLPLYQLNGQNNDDDDDMEQLPNERQPFIPEHNYSENLNKEHLCVNPSMELGVYGYAVAVPGDTVRTSTGSSSDMNYHRPVSDVQSSVAESGISGIDDMSVSVGNSSTNVSFSDIPGLCEIDDSEINLSDDNSADDDDDEGSRNLLLSAKLQTQV